MSGSGQEPAKKKTKLLILSAVVFTFSGLAVLVVFLARSGVITVPAAILMLIALVGIYFGFGILIAAHLMVRRLK
jgi:hypothetical protein